MIGATCLNSMVSLKGTDIWELYKSYNCDGTYSTSLTSSKPFSLFKISPPMLSSSLNDDDDRAPLFVACVTTTSAVAVVLASLRTYVRLRIVRSFGADDWTSLLATVYPLTLKYCIWLSVYSYDKRLDQICLIITLCFDGLQISKGFGKHVGDLTLQQQIEIWKWSFAMQYPIVVGSAFSKVSVSLLLLRLLGISASLMQRYILLGINFFVATYTFITIIVEKIACPPGPDLDYKFSGACQHSVPVIGYIQGGLLSSYLHIELGDFAY